MTTPRQRIDRRTVAPPGTEGVRVSAFSPGGRRVASTRVKTTEPMHGAIPLPAGGKVVITRTTEDGKTVTRGTITKPTRSRVDLDEVAPPRKRKASDSGDSGDDDGKRRRKGSARAKLAAIAAVLGLSDADVELVEHTDRIGERPPRIGRPVRIGPRRVRI